MQQFTINAKITVICESVDTRNGFKHVATLLYNSIEREKVSTYYLNRTWEAYEFDSVLHHLVNKSKILSDNEIVICKHFIDNRTSDRGTERLATVGATMALGDLFSDDKTQANDFKTRILKSGLGDSIDIPDDWSTLSEDEKEKRLDLVIKQLGEKVK